MRLSCVAVMAGLALVGCDKPPTRSEVDSMKQQISILIDRANEAEAKLSELESEIESNKDACDGNACDCPLPVLQYSSAPTYAPPSKPKKKR